jgi:acyl-CoA reductase-like NAD-dependent aldehyde dehydrogenase
MKNIEVLKTYKIFIGGQFPRTESGRYFSLKDKKGKLLANVCLSSRKDFRNAVVAARNAFGSWSSRTAFNRSQIIYRIAEVLEGRKQQFVEEMMLMGMSKIQANKEIKLCLDLIIYYAGWADKFQSLHSSVNPVQGSYFNFSVPEACGVVSILSDDESPLLALLHDLLPVITGGNTCIVLASEKFPLCAISFAEVLATSDLPPGVINILTGTHSELTEHFSSHMDVNAVIYSGNNKDEIKKIGENASLNVKRTYFRTATFKADPYKILDTTELKTTWHPIENIGSTGSKY